MVRQFGIVFLLAAVLFGCFGWMGATEPTAENASTHGMSTLMFIASGGCLIVGIVMVTRTRVAGKSPLVKGEQDPGRDAHRP
jgi:hypothetical protein